MISSLLAGLAFFAAAHTAIVDTNLHVFRVSPLP